MHILKVRDIETECDSDGEDMTKNQKLLGICVIIPLLTGILSGWLSRTSMETYNGLAKPFLSPPAWVFPVVWTLLYIAMGVASYLVIQNGTTNAERAIMLYIAQLVFNFCWPLIFFNLEWYFVAFLWLLVLWGLILAMYIEFDKINKKAGWLILPYLAWVTFAAYLNFAVFLLNS